MIRTLQGDCREVLTTLEAASVQMICTSPPYYNQRDYKISGQIGLEASPSAYVIALVEVFREARKVLRDDGVIFLNLGDSFASSSTYNAPNSMHTAAGWKQDDRRPNTRAIDGLRAKNLLGIPWRVAFAMQDDGWILRSDNVWGKPNGMPESVDDRPTRSHEYVFMFAKSNTALFWTHDDGRRSDERPEPDYRWINRKSQKASASRPDGWPVINKDLYRRINLWAGHDYYYDHEAVRSAPKATTQTQLATPYRGHSVKAHDLDGVQNASDIKRRIVDKARKPPSPKYVEAPGYNNPDIKDRYYEKQRGHSRRHDGFNDRWDAMERDQQIAEGGNLRSVWWISPAQFREGHFAVMPDALAEICIRAGSKPGDTVLDPFAGACTTLLVADRLQRNGVGIELNGDYVEMGRRRLTRDAGLFSDIAAQ